MTTSPSGSFVGGLTLAEFLEQLWLDAVTPASLLQTWSLQGRRLEQWNSRQAARDIQGRPDTYMGVALAGKRLPANRRPDAAHAIAIPGMWADIDIKQGGARDLEHALQIASLLAEPTIVVHTGHGIQAWWLLHKPWKFTSIQDQAAGATLAARWGAELRTLSLSTGARLDSVHDLARLMRPPGTVNAKSDPVPVMTLGGSIYRYSLQEIQGLVAHRRETITRVLPHTATPVGSVKPAPMDDALRGRIDAVCSQSSGITTAWVRTSPHPLGWSASELDMSLATRLAQVISPITGEPAFTDAEIAAALTAARLSANPADTKASRLDYLARTVTRARTTAEARANAEPKSTSVLRQINERGRAA